MIDSTHRHAETLVEDLVDQFGPRGTAAQGGTAGDRGLNPRMNHSDKGDAA